MASGTPENVRIEKRRSTLRFEATDEVIHWSNQSVAAQVFLDNFSCYLPVGERFFVESVRRFDDRITDEKLAAEARRFTYQEAQHSLSHHYFNQALFSRNKLARLSELYVQLIANISRKIYTKRFLLSLTAAAEHFTAIISNWLLVNEGSFMRKNQPAVARLWVWHAIEEIEHKSVAFDVLAAVTPGKYHAYVVRVLGMLVLSLTLFPAIAVNMLLVYLGGRYSSNRSGAQQPAQTAEPAVVNRNPPPPLAAALLAGATAPAGAPRGSSLRFFTRLFRTLCAPYLDYYRFSFHPWRHNDNSQLLNEVKAKFNFDAVAQRQDMEAAPLTGTG
jgi:predicted metal-dependent hydrolase